MEEAAAGDSAAADWPQQAEESTDASRGATRTRRHGARYARVPDGRRGGGAATARGANATSTRTRTGNINERVRERQYCVFELLSDTIRCPTILNVYMLRYEKELTNTSCSAKT